MRIDHQKVEFLLPFLRVLCAQRHAFGIDAHHLSRREIDDGDEGAFAAPKQTDVFAVLKRSFRMVIGKLRELLCFFFLKEYQHHRKGNSETENSSDDTVCEVAWNGRRDVADHGEEVGWSELVVTDIHDAQV